ncbi:MAG: LytTR family DNA-binding domain-containing protein [Lacrimispora sp.]|uniref:LytR/AlgR family response regulator transcription factor n=1 Tax=Lacrimispora sp. TaxID=2719234 RepID=UPI0039E4B0DA
MTMAKIAICDDEPVFAHQIKELVDNILTERNISYSVNSFLSGEELCSELENGASYDIAFLDIKMGGMSGIDTADKIRHHFQIKQTILIFISSYDQHAKDVFRFNTFRFLSKPICPELFKEGLLGSMELLHGQQKKTYTFKDISTGQVKLPLEEIYYFEIAKGHKINVIAVDETYSFYGRLIDVCEPLEHSGFLLIHHSYLVNYDHIRCISYNEVIMANKKKLLISGPKRKEVRKKYLDLRSEGNESKWP